MALRRRSRKSGGFLRRVTHQPHFQLVCLCWYRITLECIQCKSLNTLDWLKEFDFQNDLSLDILDVWLHLRPTTSAQTNKSSELTDKLLDVMFRMLKDQLP